MAGPRAPPKGNPLNLFPGKVHTKHQRTQNFNIPEFTSSQLVCAPIRTHSFFPSREARNSHTSILRPQRAAEPRHVHLPKPDAREAAPPLHGAQTQGPKETRHRGVPRTAHVTRSVPRAPEGRTVPRPREKRRRRLRGLQRCLALSPGPPAERGVRGHGGRAR